MEQIKSIRNMPLKKRKQILAAMKAKRKPVLSHRNVELTINGVTMTLKAVTEETGE